MFHFDLVKFYENFHCFLGGNFFLPGRNLAPPVTFVALFFWRMSFETCSKRISLAVLGRLFLTLSYFGRGVGLLRFHHHSDTQYFRGCTESPGGVTWHHR